MQSVLHEPDVVLQDINCQTYNCQAPQDYQGFINWGCIGGDVPSPDSLYFFVLSSAVRAHCVERHRYYQCEKGSVVH